MVSVYKRLGHASVDRERPPISEKETGIMDGSSRLYIGSSDRTEITWKRISSNDHCRSTAR
jgi:hypothetical protein